MKIYDKNGWLYLDDLYLNPSYNFYVVVGPRQVGKTFDTSRFLLEKINGLFLWLRRTEDEVLMLQSAPENNPFYEHDKDVFIKSIPKTPICGVYRNEGEEKTLIGYVGALSTIKTMRGFSLRGINWLVYDEFIPERHARKFKAEGDAFLNAYTTISGNRELEGQEPLKAILLSNSNDLSHDILFTLNIIRDIEEMERKNQEMRLIEKRGIAIILPRSDKVIGQRKKTALARVLNENDDFWQMAFDNDFAYNSTLYIMPVDPLSLLPYCRIGKLFFYTKKGTECFYCSIKQHGTFNQNSVFPEGQEGMRASLFYSYALIDAYNRGMLVFEEYTSKKLFIDMFNIKV